MKFNKIFKLIIYYCLLLSGLLFASFIIWSRFIRERTIREIPDYLLTEYRFWILLYICAIYLYTIKNLVKPKKTNIIPSEIIEVIYKPLMILDRSLKYNKFVTAYYNKISKQLLEKSSMLVDHQLTYLIFTIRIIPRIILSLFLLLDTFYFHKLEIFYKVILIGLLPFIYRYIKYSIKDIYNYWIETLENTYSSVLMFEEGYEYDVSRIRDTNAKQHYEKASIKEFIEIQYENIMENHLGNIDYSYVGDPYAHDYIYENYAKEKHGDKNKTSEDYDNISKLFHDLYPIIIDYKFFLKRITLLEEKPLIKYFSIIIYSIYLICWSYILFTSFHHYPIDLPMFKYFIENIIHYLKIYDKDPFSMLYQHSINKNLITPQSIWSLIKSIFNKIMFIIKNKLL